MTTYTEGVRDGEFLSWEAHPEHCREQVTVSSGNSVVAGQVVKGTLAATVPAVATDTTGMFLMFNSVDATSAAKKGSAIKRGPATVNRNLITYPSGATTPQKAAIDAALEAVGIVVRG